MYLSDAAQTYNEQIRSISKLSYTQAFRSLIAYKCTETNNFLQY